MRVGRWGGLRTGREDIAVGAGDEDEELFMEEGKSRISAPWEVGLRRTVGDALPTI